MKRQNAAINIPSSADTGIASVQSRCAAAVPTTYTRPASLHAIRSRAALVIATCTLLSIPLRADKYVRDGGTSSACTSWSDACDQLSTAEGVVSRGETIWVADGTYNGATLDVANSSTTLITVKKATVAEHGTSTGWSDAYGDGQAAFSDITFGSDYWIWDGATRNESDWNAYAAYGFRVSGSIYTYTDATVACGDNITIRYSDIGGAENASYTGSEPGEAIKSNCFIAGLANNLTIQKNRVHNISHYALLHLNGVNTCTVEDNWLGPAWGKEALRGQIALKNCTIRRNWFYNACGTSSPDACTAEIAIWDGSSGQFDNNEIYGNVIRCNGCDGNTSSVSILVGGNGSSWAGSPASNTLIFNNTIVGSASTSFDNTPSILVNGGTGNICRNNLWYSVAGTPSATCSTSSDNGEESSNPFTNWAGGVFTLASALAGSSTSSPAGNSADLAGAARGADGTWDRGAYEYSAGGGGESSVKSRTPAGARIPSGGRVQ